LKLSAAKPRIRVVAGLAPRAETPTEPLVAEEPTFVAEEAPTPLLTASFDDEDAAPFDPPDVNDLFGMSDEDGAAEADDTVELEADAETDVEGAPDVETKTAIEAEAEVEIETEVEAEVEVVAEAAPAAECAAVGDDTPAADAGYPNAAVDNDAPPFDPPDEGDTDAFGQGPLKADEPDEEAHAEVTTEPAREAAELLLVPANENTTAQRTPVENVHPRPLAAAPRAEAIICELPVPPIAIYASWDRPEIAALLADLAADRRMARAAISIERGGLDAAIVHLRTRPSPDLLILDSNLCAKEVIAGLDRVVGAMAADTKVIVVGAVNDIGLLRELAARGVKYVVPPIRQDDLVRCVCALYADADKAHVTAVIGARGGVGASTIAHNIAWSIAERRDIGTALVDLDLSFGATAVENTAESIADILHAAGEVDEAQLERIMRRKSERLHVLAAPAKMECADLDPASVQLALARVRRTSAHVILDLPHQWAPWVKAALVGADDVIIVAGPDLASLRNAENMMRVIKAERPSLEPIVLLSMVGVPKRPEITLKDFAEATSVAPVAAIAFDPVLFETAAIKALTIFEAAPRSKTARTLDALATMLTGCEPLQKPAPPKPSRAEEAMQRAVEEMAAREDVAPTADTEPRGVASEPQAANEPGTNDVAPSEPVVDADEAQDAEPAQSAPTPDESEASPLELIEPAPANDDYLAKARAVAESELQTFKSARKHPRRAGRMAAAAIGLIAPILVGAWYLQGRSPPAAAAATPAPVVAARPPAPSPALQPVDLLPEYEQALALIVAGDAQQGASLLRRTAERGFPMAQYRLAKLYERGEGVPADLAQARQWTERAAAGGNRLAMHDLGVYFARGEGATQDEAAAFRWFRQAAEFDVAASQYNLGVFYLQGRGVSADPAEALFWFLLAARQGDEEAAARAAALEADLSPMHVEQARARAQAFRPRAPNAIANGVFDAG
jgi:pilus assembly protein CpaE